MVLHQKFFQAAEIDLKAAKILTKENLFPPALYHLQQAYEKCIKGVTEKTAYKKCKDLGYDTEEITIKLLAVLMQMDIDAMQKARRQQPNPDESRIIDEGVLRRDLNKIPYFPDEG